MKDLENKIMFGYVRKGIKSAKNTLLVSFYVSTMLTMSILNEINCGLKDTYTYVKKGFRNY